MLKPYEYCMKRGSLVCNVLVPDCTRYFIYRLG